MRRSVGGFRAGMPWLVAALLAAAMLSATGEAAAQSGSQAEVPVLPYRTTCPVAPDPAWREPEQFAWSKICTGEVARFGAQDEHYPRVFDQAKAAGRTVRSRFLQQILSDPHYADVIPYRGVTILGAFFPDELDLGNLAFDKPLKLVGSVFLRPVKLVNYRTESEVDFSDSWFRYVRRGQNDAFSLDLRNARVGLSVILGGTDGADIGLRDMIVGQHAELDGLYVGGDLVLDGSRIAGMVWMRGAEVHGRLMAQLLQVGKNVVMWDTIIAAPEFDPQQDTYDYRKLTPGLLEMTGAHIAGSLLIGYGNQVPWLAESEQEAPDAEPPPPPGTGGEPAAAVPPTDANSPAPQPGEPPAASPRILDPRFGFIAGTLNLSASQIGGELWVRESDIRHYLNLEDVHTGDDVWLTNSRVTYGNLSGLSTEGFLLLQESQFEQRLLMDSGEVGRQLVMSSGTRIAGRLSMPGLTVGESFHTNGATIVGPASLQSLKTGGSLLLDHGTQFLGSLDVSYSQIGGSLDLTDGQFASVDLTGTRIANELRLAVADPKAGPDAPVPPVTARFVGEQPTLNLRNVSADSLQDITNLWPQTLEIDGLTYERFGAASERGGMRAHSAGELIEWLGKQKTFSTQPYSHLADLLRKSGDREKANEVLYEGRRKQWNEVDTWTRTKFWLGVNRLVTGFGVYPERILFWVAGAVLLGYFIFGFDTALELRRLTRTQRLVYSLDMLLPIVHLRHRHDEIDLEWAWARFYLYCHKLFGYLLASLLIAALTGGELIE